MPRLARKAPKRRISLPWRAALPLWIIAIGMVLISTIIVFRSSALFKQSISSLDTAIPGDSQSATFSDYFDSGWRSGSSNSPILIEATYFFPELAAALDQLPGKSSHQGEISDRIALAKPNVDSIVFYVTLASGADPIDALKPTEILTVTDSSGNNYKVRDWVEANAALLPASTVPQRIGLLIVSKSADNNRTLEQIDPNEIILTAKGISQEPQNLRWNLKELKNFLTHYERNK